MYKVWKYIFLEVNDINQSIRKSAFDISIEKDTRVVDIRNGKTIRFTVETPINLNDIEKYLENSIGESEKIFSMKTGNKSRRLLFILCINLILLITIIWHIKKFQLRKKH
jgi:hypothetical protein